MVAEKSLNLHGSIVALVTPMHADGNIDWETLQSLIDWHITEGTHAFVIGGTTGEANTLLTDEHIELFVRGVEMVKGRVPVIGGTGSNSTTETVRLTQQAQRSGVDACLLVVPYYNRPSQNGLYEHFRMIAHEVNVPQILYNVPSRTIVSLELDTIVQLAQIDNIVGIKESSGDIEFAQAIMQHTPPPFTLYSGDDATAMAAMLVGARGTISVVANIVPATSSQLCESAINGNKEQANQFNDTLVPLYNGLNVEANPIPVKWALSQMSRIPTGIRLPLTPLQTQYHSQMQAALSIAGIDITN